MISWSSIVYGAALSAVLAAALARGHRITAALTCAVAVAAGPVAWNAILRATHASRFFHDAPIAVMPASRQDTGSGVFTLAAAALLTGLGPLGHLPARRTATHSPPPWPPSWSTSTSTDRKEQSPSTP
jgi:hypothetical protein